MHRSLLAHRTSVLTSLALALALAACKSTPAPAPEAPPPAPPPAPATPITEYPIKDNFSNLYVSGTTYFSGYATAAGLRAIKERGVQRVISLKTNEEVRDARGYDEAALTTRIGLELVVIPITPATFSQADVDRFAEVFGQGETPTLIHCGSSNTVGGLWAAYLYLKRGVPREDALAAGRAAGLKDPRMMEATQRVLGEAPAPR